jgi:hypothetical protein
MTGSDKDPWKSFTEEIEVAGNQVVEEVKRLIAEGNVRKLRLRSANDDVVLEVPLTLGAVTGGVVALAAPALMVLGTVAALLARVRIEVVRETEEPEAAAEVKRPQPEDIDL